MNAGEKEGFLCLLSRERGETKKKNKRREKKKCKNLNRQLFSLSFPLSLLFFHSFERERAPFFFLPQHHHFNKAMATTGEQLAAWKQLGGTVRTVKKNKEFIAPGGEKRERVFFLYDWGTTGGDFEKKDDAQHVDFGCLRRLFAPFEAPSPSLICLESRGDGGDTVSALRESKEKGECVSQRARSEARVSQPSLSLAQRLNRCSPLLSSHQDVGLSLESHSLCSLSTLILSAFQYHRREVFQLGRGLRVRQDD